MAAYVEGQTLSEVLRLCSVEDGSTSTAEVIMKHIAALRKVIQATTASALRSASIDERAVRWLAAAASKMDLKGNERAAIMLTLAQVIKQCQIDARFLHHIVTAIKMNIQYFARTHIADANQFISTVMIIHQMEDMLSQLGANRVDQLQALSSCLLECAQLLSTLRTGHIQFESPHSDQYDIDVAKIFAMIAEISSSAELSSDVTNSMIPHLELASERLIEVIEHSKIAHEGYLSAFQHCITLLSRSNASVIMVRYDRCLTLVNTLALDNVIHAKRVEILVGYLSCFYDAMNEESSSSTTKQQIGYHVMHQQDGESQFVDRLINSFDSLQQKMKETMQNMVKEKKKGIKDFKVLFSEIRKGCISCLENVFVQDRVWLQHKIHKKKFWDLCIKSLSTPVLFATAYHTSLKTSPLMTKQMIDYLIQALEMVKNYSLTSAEDILETIRQFIQFQSPEMMSHVKLLPLLIYSMEHLPKGITTDDLEGQWKWKTSVVTCLHEFYQQLLNVEATTKEQIVANEYFSTSTAALMKMLFQEIIQEHIKANSKYGSSSSGGKHKASSNMEKMDESVELFHASLACLTSVFEYLFSCDSYPSMVPYDQMLLCCIEGAMKPIILEDDYMDVLMTTELLARISAVYQRTSFCLLNHNYVVASMAAMCVAGSSNTDSTADRIRVTLQLFASESTSAANLKSQLQSILASVKSSTNVDNDSLNTSCLAALGTLFDHVSEKNDKLFDIVKSAQENNNSRMSVLNRLLSAI